VYFRSGPPVDFEIPSKEARSLFASRVTLDPVLVDLCTLKTVFTAANTLALRVPRLDVMICNAGIGGWNGLDWWGAWRQFVNEGIVAMVSRPNWKICRVGAQTQLQVTGDVRSEEGNASDEPILGEVFCANVFGHYLFVHENLGLLSRGLTDELSLGRVIWIGTGEVMARHFSIDDIQALKSMEAYEATKRLMDLLILGAQDGAKSEAEQYLTIDATALEQERDIEQSLYIVSEKDLTASSPSSSDVRNSQSCDTIPPQMYISHPGVCLTAIAPLNFFMTWMQIATIYIARWLGSKWHTNTSYKGATSTVWLTLASEEILIEEKAPLKKWGSMVSRWGKESAVETPVDGWGLEGEAVNEEYSENARKVWKEMESLRKEWTERLHK
jgi:3-keto steroid reductase